MKLLTQEIERAIPARYSQEQNPDPLVVAKFFTPDSNWTWYAIEGEREPNGDFTFFGLVEGFATEMGYFTLSQLESARGPLGLPIERDLHFSPRPLSEVRR